MIELIPAIDIIGGQCVRLTKGDYAARKTYEGDALNAALSIPVDATLFAYPESPLMLTVTDGKITNAISTSFVLLVNLEH